MANTRIDYLTLSYPNFVLGTIIDPEEANQNNYEIVTKTNEIADWADEAMTNSESAIQIATDLGNEAKDIADNAVNIAEVLGNDAITISEHAKATSEDALGQDEVEPYTGALGAMRIVAETKIDVDQALIEVNQAVTQANNAFDSIDEKLDESLWMRLGALTVDGSFTATSDNTTTFTVAMEDYDPTKHHLTLVYRGVYLMKDQHYTLSGNDVTLNFPINTGEMIYYFSQILQEHYEEFYHGTDIVHGTIPMDAIDGEFDTRLNQHATRHNSGGADQINLTGLPGINTELQNHYDEISPHRGKRLRDNLLWGYREQVKTYGIYGDTPANIVLDIEDANIFRIDLTNATEIDIVTASVSTSLYSYTVIIRQPATIHPVTWSDKITWSGDRPPVMVENMGYILTFINHTGSSNQFLGFIAGDFYAG